MSGTVYTCTDTNVFASELLMPTEWVKKQLSRYADYGLDYVIRRLCDEAGTSLMACFYALENAMQSGNVLLVFTPSVDFAKRFVSNNTEICYLRNMDFQECCETMCTGRWEYTIGTYNILHYQFLPRPAKPVVEETYRKCGSITSALRDLSGNYIMESLHNLSYILNSIEDRYAVWIFLDRKLLLFSKDSLLQINMNDSPEEIIWLCNHYKYYCEYDKTEDGVIIIAIKEPVYEDIRTWKVESTDSKYLCNEILDDIYAGKEQDSRRRMISGIIGNANNADKGSSVDALYNLIQKRMRRPELDEFVSHPDFNRFVSLKSFELVNRKRRESC